MKLRFAAQTHVGLKRSGNEDSYLVDKTLKLFVVCDGMGGHAAGEIASSMAVRTVRDAVAKTKSEIPELADGSDVQRQRLRRILQNAVRLASLKIFERSQAQAELRGMGTTLTLMLIAGQRAFVGHVGDSRLYLYRSGQVHLITTDHSLVTDMIRAGRISPDETDKVPFTNALTRAVGVYPNVEADTIEIELLPGDSFLLCSDGLHNYLSDNSLIEGLQQEFDKRAEWFVNFANGAGGKDNITVILVDVDEVEDSAQSQRLRLTLETLRKIPLFQHLTYTELVRVINVSKAREVNSGEIIIREGDEGDALYVVLEGEVLVDQGGRVVAQLGPGRHFGEMSLVDNQPRSATVLAGQKTVLIRIARREFYELLRQDSVTAVKLLWNFIQSMTTRLRAAGAQSDSTLEHEDTSEFQGSPYTDPKRVFEPTAFANTDPEIRVPDLTDQLEDTDPPEDEPA